MKRVCVVGAGTMGSGIAAHLANVGFSVTLLDRTVEEAKASFDRARRVKPPHFYLPETADSITLGGISSHLDLVREADWVCEAIIEKPEAKKSLYAALEPHLKPTAWITTNTSGLEISLLAQERSPEFRRRFLGTHFFNPPRYLKLLELIPTHETDPRVVAEMTEFLQGPAARRVVLAKDTPGFIANRFGMWAMYKAVHVAEKLQLTVEEVDEITGPFLGRPRTGSFRLNDVVGLDIMEDIAQNLLSRCPSDPHISILQAPRSLAALKEKGWIGAKAGQGYTRRDGKEMLVFDLITHAYRNRLEPDLPLVKQLVKLPLAERLRQGLASRCQVGEFLREYLIPVLRYADYLKEEISYSAQDFDRVMQWGFGWEEGPFRMSDMIGGAAIGLSSEPWFTPEGQRSWSGAIAPLPSEPEFASFSSFPEVERKEAIVLRDLGDGVLGIGIATKMGAISPLAVREIGQVLDQKPERIVIAGEGKHFSAGFDLRFFLGAIEASDWAGIEAALEEFQNLCIRLGRLPSVAAIQGYCLGGGFEVAASCTLIAAAPESQIGLPESRVGLIPGGTGTLLMAERSQSSAKVRAEAILLLGRGQISDCADHARALGFLRREDTTVYQQDALITEAKRLALSASPFGRPAWTQVAGPLSGLVDQMVESSQKSGEFTSHDALVVRALKEPMAKAGSFDEALVRERKAFLELCREGLTLARIRHMLENGKPLRN